MVERLDEMLNSRAHVEGSCSSRREALLQHERTAGLGLVLHLQPVGQDIAVKIGVELYDLGPMALPASQGPGREDLGVRDLGDA